MKIKSLEEKVKRTYYLQVYQVEALKALSIKTRVKQVDFVREAVDDLIFKYREKLPKNLMAHIRGKRGSKNC